MVFSPEKKQRLIIIRNAPGYDFGKVNGVVSTFVTCHNLAFDVSHYALNKRQPVWSSAPAYSFKLVDSFRGKAARDLFLFMAQDVYDETLRLFKARIALRVPVNAHQYQRRVQGNRGKRVRCDAVFLSVLVLGRDNGNAGSEAPQHVAKVFGIQRHGLISPTCRGQIIPQASNLP